MRILPTYSNQHFNQPKININYKKNDNQSASANAVKNSEINYTSAITTTTIASVLCVFMLSRGFQKNTSKYLNRYKNYLGAKLEFSGANESSKTKKFYEFTIRRINSILKKSESINNITSLKDTLFMKFMYKTAPTKKIHESITNYFEKLSRKSVIDSYKKTKQNFDNMNKILDKLDEIILKNAPDEKFLFGNNNYPTKEYTKKQLIQFAKIYRESALDIVNVFISKESLNYRYKYMNDVTSTLYSRFWNVSFKDFWSKNNKFKRKEMWQTFIAAEQIKGDKTKLASGVAAARNALSLSNIDKSEILQEYIKKLDGIIPPQDKEGLKIIRKLEWFAKHPDGFKENKTLFKEELKKLSSHKIPTTDINLSKTQEDCKKAYINILSEYTGDSTGEIQDMLSIYYKIAPFELEKSGALPAVKKAVKSFDDSSQLECVEFFDKIRDLRLGSAPTDILTILFSTVALTLGLGYEKDKDERKSMMLKSGIPILGAIITATYSATKLVSGGKSLALGFLSGIALNQIGIITDSLRKKLKKNTEKEYNKEQEISD